jgi:hypothetical protein
MEFSVTMPGPIDPGAIEQAIREIDPAAVVDIDPAASTLRVAATVDLVQLLALFNRAGYPVDRHHVAQAASVCCGGCGG